MKTKISLRLMAAALAATAPVLEADFVSQPVALSASVGTARGLGPQLGTGVNFAYFGQPLLNDRGDVAFTADLAGTGVTFDNGLGLFVTTSGALSNVARTGTAGAKGPGLGGDLTFSYFEDIVLNTAGQIAFRGTLEGTGVASANDRGVFLRSGTSITAIAREGVSAPGPNLGAGVVFSDLANSTMPVLNDLGKVAFFARVSGTGVGSTNNSGIFSNIDGTLSAIARTGSAGPGPNVEAGVYYSGFNSDPVLNNSGQVAFAGDLAGTGVGFSNDDALFVRGPGGSPTLVARGGIAGPGPDVQPFDFAGFYSPAINTNGLLAFLGFFTNREEFDNGFGVFKAAPGGTPTLLARDKTDGDYGPHLGEGMTFGVIVPEMVINAKNKVAFIATVYGPEPTGVADYGIFSDRSGTVAVVARTGTDGPLGPHVGAGVTFESFGGSVFDHSEFPNLNVDGDIAFLAPLTGTGVTFDNDMGLFVAVAGADVQPVVRKGNLFDVDPSAATDLRQIASIDFVGNSSGEDGRQQGFNDMGVLVFGLSFNDGSSGIFKSRLVSIAGDASFDNRVGFADLVILAQNYNTAANASFHRGDFNGDGAVNFADLVVLAQNYNTGTGVIALPGDASFAADWARAQALAPEPMFAVGGFVLFAGISRRRDRAVRVGSAA